VPAAVGLLLADLFGPDEGRADGPEDAREWFPALAGLYDRCAANGRVLVTESID
jgi:hypothetical protein